MGLPVLTIKEHAALVAARDSGQRSIQISLDLDLSLTNVAIEQEHWSIPGATFPYLEICKKNTIYYWSGTTFEVVARYDTSLIKLVPTEWGAPTFHIDGVKMLPTAHVSPYEDAKRKVALIEPQGKIILDTCGGLGYFAAWCLKGGAKNIVSYEVNPDVLWLRGFNPWSPPGEASLAVNLGDIADEVGKQGSATFDAILHDPPRFALAGDLYSQAFYDQLARVLKPRGILFHYTGTPNKLTSGRNVPNEVSKRLATAGFNVRIAGDGLLATKRK